MKIGKVIDISQPIANKMTVHPVHPKPMIWQYLSHEECKGLEAFRGVTFQTKMLLMNDHTGTHIDAFCHFDPDPKAESIHEMDLGLFMGDAVCIDISHLPENEYVTLDQLKDAVARSGVEMTRGDIVLFHTGIYERHKGSPEYATRHPGFSEEAWRWLCEQGMKNAGVDNVSPDGYFDNSYPCHRVSRAFGITHMENFCNLDKLVGKRFTFIGLPLKLVGASGSPIRAVAILDEE